MAAEEGVANVDGHRERRRTSSREAARHKSLQEVRTRIFLRILSVCIRRRSDTVHHRLALLGDVFLTAFTSGLDLLGSLPAFKALHVMPDRPRKEKYTAPTAILYLMLLARDISS